MTSSYNNAWLDAVLEQIWFVRQATDVAAKSIDPQLLRDPQAMTDYCLNPTAQRLNPLEFHGKRRSPRPRGSPSDRAS
jgi:hypothetical protein